MASSPTLSIITSSFNDLENLRVTAQVIFQSLDQDFEWIVIDGASSDGTAAFLQDNDDKITYWVSEQDSGIYDAWNKGLAKASGPYALYLGAGDFFDIDSLKQSIEMLKKKTGDEKEIYLGTTKKYNSGKITYVAASSLLLDRPQYGLGFMHPCSIIPTQFYRSVGGFDTNYSIASDARTLLLIEQQIKPTRINIPLLVYMDDAGVSSRQWIKAALQYLDILRELEVVPANQLGQYRRKVYLRWLLFKKINIKKYLSKSKLVARNTLTALLNAAMWLPFFSLRYALLRLAGAKLDKTLAIHRRVRVLAPWKLSIGASSTVNRAAFLDARGVLSIGANTMIGHQSAIYTLGHDLHDPFFSAKESPVTIGNNVVIFPHAIIQPGVSIADGAVVLPGSVVTKSIEKNTIVGGVPAQFKAMRNENQLYQLDYKQWLAL